MRAKSMEECEGAALDGFAGCLPLAAAFALAVAASAAVGALFGAGFGILAYAALTLAGTVWALAAFRDL